MRKLAVLAGVAVLSATTFTPAVAEHGHGLSLPLGPPDLPETRTVQTLQRGVTLTTIVRGESDEDNGWTVEIAVPRGADDPDPDAPPTAIASRDGADRLANSLRDNGFSPRVEEVRTPRVADFAGGTLGFRVRTGHFADKPTADALLAQVRARGFTASSVFTGWDGDPDDRGPWRVRVLTIDPKTFRGDLVADFGPDLERRETTSALSAARDATAAVNAGFFVLDPTAGAPGDPAGLGVYDSRVLSEAVNGRPTLVFDTDGHHAAVERYTWTGTVTAHHPAPASDGVDRVASSVAAGHRALASGGVDRVLGSVAARHREPASDGPGRVSGPVATSHRESASGGVDGVAGSVAAGHRALASGGVDRVADSVPAGHREQVAEGVDRVSGPVAARHRVPASDGVEPVTAPAPWAVS